MRMRTEKGFTLLEVLVATLILGIAVVGLLSGLSTSLRTASRLTDYDRAVLAARAQMDVLLAEPAGLGYGELAGEFNPRLVGNLRGGWRARVSVFEAAPGGALSAGALDRIELEVWWMNGGVRRTFPLEGYRARLPVQGVPPS